MPELPSHLALGRGSFPGPVAGGPLVYSFGPFDTSSAAGDVLHIAFPVSLDIRIQKITVRSRANGTPSAAVRFYQNSAASITNATALAASIPNVDVAGNYTVAAAGGTVAFASSTVRDVAKGQFIVGNYTYATGAPATLVDHVVIIEAIALGHVNDDPAND